MERETGLEPATNCLGSNHSTTELLPLDEVIMLYPQIRTNSMLSYINVVLIAVNSLEPSGIPEHIGLLKVALRH